MVDAQTLEFLKSARARRQVEISARLSSSGAAALKNRQSDSQMASQAWTDAKALIEDAVRAYQGDGLRILRAEKTRPGLILTAPAALWRRFFQEQEALINRPAIEFAHYEKPWSFGLPGFPE